MIVESTNSQIDDKSYLPLVMVKNGLWTHLFSDGAISANAVKKLKLPEARYDYLLYIDVFTGGLDRIAQYNVTRYTVFVDRNRTEIELPLESVTSPCFIHADLITREI